MRKFKIFLIGVLHVIISFAVVSLIALLLVNIILPIVITDTQNDMVAEIYILWGLVGLLPIFIQSIGNARWYCNGYGAQIHERKNTRKQVWMNIVCSIAALMIPGLFIFLAFFLFGAGSHLDISLPDIFPLIMSMFIYLVSSLILAVIHLLTPLGRPHLFPKGIKGIMRHFGYKDSKKPHARKSNESEDNEDNEDNEDDEDYDDEDDYEEDED